MFALLFIAVACEQSLENGEITLQESTTVGDWTVSAYIDDNIIFGPFTISTLPTSDNKSIIIKDNDEFWKFQTKAELNNSKDEFSCLSSINEIGTLGTKINILNGNFLDADSINFSIQFEDDETPYGYTYNIKGHRK